MITEQIFQIQEIDDAFTGLIGALTMCDDEEPTIAHAGLLRSVFNQHDKTSTLFTPENENEEPWALDNSTDFQTLHILQGGERFDQRKFGTRTIGDFRYIVTTICVHFGAKSYVNQTIEAIETNDWCEVVSFDLDTENILARYLLLRADENFNYPPNMTAWAVTYYINAIH